MMPIRGGSDINAQMVPLRGQPCATPLEARKSGRRDVPHPSMRGARETGRNVHAQKARLKILGARKGDALATARADLDNVAQELTPRYRASLDGGDVFHQRLELSVRGGSDDLQVSVLHGDGGAAVLALERALIAQQVRLLSVTLSSWRG
eukprot:7623064-Pyramimonas_sp.AAC.1